MMNVELKGNKLTIIVDVDTNNLVQSGGGTGKMDMLCASGYVPTQYTINGLPLKVSVNAGIKHVVKSADAA